ncbi:MAG: hypothetical protein WCJ45_00720 [bacterium]
MYNPRSITRTQIALYAICAVFHLNKLVKLPIPISHGRVPIANIAIIAIHIKKLPVLMAYNCMANVNPQGKKNVNTPLPNVHKYLLNHVDLFFKTSVSFFANNFPVGKLSDIALSLGDI